MSRRKKEEILICTRHDYIVELCESAIKILKGNSRVSEEDKKVLREQVREIRGHTLKAKSDGQGMENRLRLYKEGIEKLGFERVCT